MAAFRETAYPETPAAATKMTFRNIKTCTTTMIKHLAFHRASKRFEGHHLKRQLQGHLIQNMAEHNQVLKNIPTIKRILQEHTRNGSEDKEKKVRGWVRTVRHHKNHSFIALDDGSCMEPLQVFIDHTKVHDLGSIHTGCSVQLTGHLVKSVGANQTLELSANAMELIGSCPPEVKRL